VLVGAPKASELSLTLGAAAAAVIEAKLLSSTGSLGLLGEQFAEVQK